MSACRLNGGQGGKTATAPGDGSAAAEGEVEVGYKGTPRDTLEVKEVVSSSTSATVTLLPMGAWSRVSVAGSSIMAEAGVVHGLQEESAAGGAQQASSSSRSRGVEQHMGMRRFDGEGVLVATFLRVSKVPQINGDVLQ
jgi:hypothetical protein